MRARPGELPPAATAWPDMRSHLAAIVEHSNDTIFSRRFDDIVTTWKAALARIFGYLTMNAEQLINIANAPLNELAMEVVPVDARGRTIARQGIAATEVVAVAKRLKVDLIVLSMHGHTELERLLMGSVAEQVVRHDKCPVSVVRKPRVRRNTR